MLIYTFVFGVVFGATAPIGEPSGLNVYALYLLCGILPWGFFSQVIICFVQWSIEKSLLAVVLIIAGSPIIPWLPVTILLMVCLAVYASGFALALSAAAVFFRDLRYLWGILVQVMFFATPIIYTPDRLEGKLPAVVDFILTWNPMAVFILTFRHMLYGGSAPQWGEMLYVAVVSIGVFVTGWAIFSRLSRRVAEEL
jgi:ABC-type polysaccharide/polyol phosphate export permease